MSVIIVLIFIIAAAGAGAVYFYNDLVQKQNLMREGLSGIDVQLKRRHDLIPKLVETVGSYMRYEQTLLQSVTELRSRAGGAQKLSEKAAMEDDLGQAMNKIIAVAEKYPDLKANSGFMELQKNISIVEDDLQMARRYYNATVRDYNILIHLFPSNLIAGTFGFKDAEFFGLTDAEEKKSPEVSI